MFAGRAARALLASACLIAVVTATPVEAETLKGALAKAYKTNPQIDAARAQLRATDENVPIQKSSGLPSLQTSGTFTEFIKQSSSSFISPQRSLDAQLNLSVPIYQGGAVRNGIHAAETRVVAGRASLRGTESSLFSQVVAAYMDVIQNEAIVALSKSNVHVLKVTLQSTTDRFKIGDLTRTDVAQAQSRLDLARGNLMTARSNLISARENFVALVGEAPKDLQTPPPLEGLPASVATALQVALKNNPDLAAAKEQAKAADYDIKVAGAGRLPKVSLFGGPSYTNYLGTLGSLPGSNFALAQASTSVQAGVQFSIPLFQGGRPAAQQRQATAQASAALDQVNQTERNIVKQVRAAYASWKAADSIIVSTRSAVKAAALSLEGVRAENSVGNRTIVDVLNAQQELLNSQVQLVTAKRNAYVAGFTLLAAMGRVEARDLGLQEYGPLYNPVANYKRVHDKIWDWQKDPAPKAASTSTVDIPAQDGDIPPNQGPRLDSARQ